MRYCSFSPSKLQASEQPITPPWYLSHTRKCRKRRSTNRCEEGEVKGWRHRAEIKNRPGAVPLFGLSWDPESTKSHSWHFVVWFSFPPPPLSSLPSSIAFVLLCAYSRQGIPSQWGPYNWEPLVLTSTPLALLPSSSFPFNNTARFDTMGMQFHIRQCTIYVEDGNWVSGSICLRFPPSDTFLTDFYSLSPCVTPLPTMDWSINSTIRPCESERV